MRHIKKIVLYFTALLLTGAISLPIRAQINPAITSGNTGKDSLAVQVDGPLFSLPQRLSTSATSAVAGSTLYKTPAPNLTNTLYGLLPGLIVRQGSGEPGNDAALLAIRGLATYGSSNYAIFIDGFQTTFDYFQYLQPAEIETISILKDAAALATLGMKGANGAVWITTKRGSEGKPKVQLQARTGYTRAQHIEKPLGAYDYARFYNEALSNDNGRQWTPRYSQDQLDHYHSGQGINTDWYNATVRNQSPFSAADASVSGGGPSARYFVLLGFQQTKGLYNTPTDDQHANAGQTQFNLRTNLDFRLFRIFDGRVDIGGRMDDRKYPNFSTDSLWRNLAQYPNNIYLPQNTDGTYPGTGTYPDNPYASIRALGYRSTHDRTLQAVFSLKEHLDFVTPGLYLEEAASFNTWTRGTYNVTKNYARLIDGLPQTPDVATNYSILDDNGTDQYDWKQFRASAGYEKKSGKHDFHAAVSYLQYMYNVDERLNGAAKSNIQYAFQNLSGRVHYAFDERYIAELGFAYSGSDNYAPGNRFGFYPSLSAAWNISQESFFTERKHWDFLRLRASAGKSGYDGYDGGRYLYQRYYSTMGNYPTGNGIPADHNTLEQAYTPNAAIFAEQSVKYNLGIEASWFHSLSLTLDVFMDKRRGIVTPDSSRLAVYGTAPAFENLGRVTNRGVEGMLSYSKKTGKAGYHVSLLASYNRNKIDYMDEVPPASPASAKTGRSIGSAFGYVFDGFYDVSDFNADGSLRADLPSNGLGAVQPGDIRYKDLNHDNRIDQRDMKMIGSSYWPQLTYALDAGFSFWGFDIRVLLQGEKGRSINLLDASSQTEAFNNNGNIYSIAEGRWAYYPDLGIDTRASATYPRLSTGNNSNNYQPSTFWLKDGRFLRLRNVELGYTFYGTFLKQAGFSGIRLYATAINLCTWSPLLRQQHLDPETLSGYPNLKSLTVGFTATF